MRLPRTADGTGPGHRRQIAERAGRHAEWLAAAVLRVKGYRMLARRWRSGGGEIDLVVARGRTLVFVEVKHRADAEEAIAAVSARQRARIIQGAEQFLARHPAWQGCITRFDIVLVFGRWRWQHILNAWGT